MPLMLDKWRAFVSSSEKDTAYVFNCVLLQNPMCETMMRFNFPKEASEAYIRQIAGIIRPMEPAVIYLQNSDIAPSVERASRERPGWLDAVIDYHVNGKYGKSIGAEKNLCIGRSPCGRGQGNRLNIRRKSWKA